MAGPAALPSSSFHKENYTVGGGEPGDCLQGLLPSGNLNQICLPSLVCSGLTP